jgi:hypothetical protein
MSDHTEEARNLKKKADSMQIIGSDADFTGKNKYAVMMQGNLYYFSVHNDNVESFLNNFKEGGKYHEISSGRLPSLLTNKTLTTNQQLKIIEKGSKPAISDYDYLQQEVKIAKENGDTEKENELNEILIDNYTNLKTKYDTSEDLNIFAGGGDRVEDASLLVGYGSVTPKGVNIDLDEEGRTILKSNKNPVPDHLPVFDYALKKDKSGEVTDVIHNPGVLYMKSMK